MDAAVLALDETARIRIHVLFDQIAHLVAFHAEAQGFDTLAKLREVFYLGLTRRIDSFGSPYELFLIHDGSCTEIEIRN